MTLLIAVGLSTTIGGTVTALVAKGSIDNASGASSSLPTLPVHAYVQYTQYLVLPDYTGLWIGITLASVGVIVLVLGVVPPVLRRPAA
jgi:hypothetical protein